ncbi:MAG TPA: ATP synthase F0 subunit B [Clostridiaceae bacterium]|nr:ATP synthase F0 subunit B [Clostridiaceae bacterium]
MAKEALEAVLSAEEKARQIVRQARETAAQTIEDARTDAETKKAELISAAEAEARSMDEAAQQAGSEDGRANLEQSQALAANYEMVADSDLSPIVDIVVEKVVQYGNR